MLMFILMLLLVLVLVTLPLLILRVIVPAFFLPATIMSNDVRLAIREMSMISIIPSFTSLSTKLCRLG